LVILCGHEAEAREALEEVQTWTASVGRQLHPVKRRRVDAAQGGGLDFLGYHWERGYRWPRKKSLEKFQASIGAQTGRTNGQSLKAIILSVNRTLKGWFAYFQHRHYTTFSRLEGWVGMRLRSILRRRRGGEGRGRGRDHQLWPNAFFAERGLFSLVTAPTLARQSSGR